jgi:hypothetical protein
MPGAVTALRGQPNVLLPNDSGMPSHRLLGIDSAVCELIVRPLGHAMNKTIKKILIVLVCLGALLLVGFILVGSVGIFMILSPNPAHAGTWEDDPKNWYRAFNKEQPSEVKVIHSKYWRSAHFTLEFIYYFEVETTPEWRDAFLKKRSLGLVSPSTARSFRTNNDSDTTPNWFASDTLDHYDVWDKAGYFGSVWINKTNGHIYFYDEQL